VNEEQKEPKAPEEERGESQPSEEEVRAALEEQMRRITVQDVLLQTVVTLVNLSGRRLTVEGEKDVEQGRLGIDAVRALLPLCPEEQMKPVREALDQLQMIYAREVGQGGQPAEAKPDPEREKGKSKLWTPPGT
jgi:hypothetical protein